MNVRMHSYELRIDFFSHTCFGLDLKCVCIHTNPPLVKGDLGGFSKFQIPPSPHFFRGDVNNYMLPLVIIFFCPMTLFFLIFSDRFFILGFGDQII